MQNQIEDTVVQVVKYFAMQSMMKKKGPAFGLGPKLFAITSGARNVLLLTDNCNRLLITGY